MAGGQRSESCIRLLGRAECELCELMEIALISHEQFRGLRLEHLNVDLDQDLLRRFGLRVPVLLDCWNDVICEGQFDALAFEEWRQEMAKNLPPRGSG